MWSSPLMWATSKTRDSTLRNCPLTLPPYLRNGITRPNSVSRSTLIGEVEGRDVLLVDDIIDTRVESFQPSQSYWAALRACVACVHPVFSGPAWERLRELARRERKLVVQTG